MTAQEENWHKLGLRFIQASGTLESGLMIIGEAGGYEEMIQGKPFVGRSGKLLDKMLEYIDIKRENTYITNIVKIHPQNNRTPTSEELSSWLPLLHEEIYNKAPNVIMTLGNSPSKTLISSELGITKLRGKSYPYEHDNYTIQIVPTYHPSYLLRKSGDKIINQQVKEDLKLVQELLNK